MSVPSARDFYTAARTCGDAAASSRIAHATACRHQLGTVDSRRAALAQADALDRMADHLRDQARMMEAKQCRK